MITILYIDTVTIFSTIKNDYVNKEQTINQKFLEFI